ATALAASVCRGLERRGRPRPAAGDALQVTSLDRPPTPSTSRHPAEHRRLAADSLRQTAISPATRGGADATDARRARAARPDISARAGLQYLALAGGLAPAAVMNVNRLSQNGYSNIFYSAGVKSMLRSLHNFVFVSFDPGGLTMIDKPPLGLWLQTASAKLFGFSPLSLLLPEAIAGVLTV